MPQTTTLSNFVFVSARQACIDDVKPCLTPPLQNYKKVNLGRAVTFRFLGVVVITSALHAEGLGFEPRRNLTAFFFPYPFPFSPFSLPLSFFSPPFLFLSPSPLLSHSLQEFCFITAMEKQKHKHDKPDKTRATHKMMFSFLPCFY